MTFSCLSPPQCPNSKNPGNPLVSPVSELFTFTHVTVNKMCDHVYYRLCVTAPLVGHRGPKIDPSRFMCTAELTANRTEPRRQTPNEKQVKQSRNKYKHDTTIQSKDWRLPANHLAWLLTSGEVFRDSEEPESAAHTCSRRPPPAGPHMNTNIQTADHVASLTNTHLTCTVLSAGMIFSDSESQLTALRRDGADRRRLLAEAEHSGVAQAE